MKRALSGLVMVVLMATFFASEAQQKKFKLQPGANVAKGVVLAKVKSSYKEEFASSSSARIQRLPMKSAKPMVNPLLAKKGAAWRGPVAAKPVVDISQYFEINFDPGTDVESYINQLYQTGYFEIVEPCYLRYAFFTPNDVALSNQYYLTNIKAFQAWNITHGNPNVTIAIVDAGGNLSHSDLSGNLYINTKDPVNGIDDDHDGYIDNYRGWDFIGADTLNAVNPNFIGDNDPSIVEGGDSSHGTSVAGCASASTNNSNGIAGVGFNTTLMFTKHSADNQNTTKGAIYNGFKGITYAANQGIKIINCSWGGGGFSQIEQDMINHVTLDLGSLVVAAAGNAGNNVPSYPASYDNVLSVAATDQNDDAAYFTSFGSTVDLAAPGLNIYTTAYNNVYTTISGTSFSSPITAGAAALVLAVNPTFTPLQIAEQLRVSSDASALYTANPTMTGLLGHGRLDIYSALTTTFPSLRASNATLADGTGLTVQPGNKGFLTLDITNYLHPTSATASVILSSTSSFVNITKSTWTPGVIGTSQTIDNTLAPFELTLSASVAENAVIPFTLTYSDGSYADTQSITITVNPTYLDINLNQVTTTISEIGRLGYSVQTATSGASGGSGFIFNGLEMVSEIGLMMGTAPTNLYDNVRGVFTTALTFDEDFVSLMRIEKKEPGARSASEIFCEFSNSATVSSQALVVNYQSLVWQQAPYDKFVIFEYKINNPTAATISNFYFGMFADWDIDNSGANDAASWYPQEKLGYVYPASSTTLPLGGTQLLTGAPNYYAMDNDPAVAGNPFGNYDGFTDSEKYTTLTTPRLTAGMNTSTGDDVSHVVSTGPYSINPGQTITIAYALHAAATLIDLQKSAAYADTLYNHTLKAVMPVADTVKTCYNSTANVSASGAATLKWYTQFIGGTSFFTGNQFTTAPLKTDTAFYVSNADSSFESVRTKAVVSLIGNPKIIPSSSTTFCENASITLSVGKAGSYLWSTGETTSSIQVSKAGQYSVSVKDATLGCLSVSDTITTFTNVLPLTDFETSGSLVQTEAITFKDLSTGAVNWNWNFGDGTSATVQEPVHTYTTASTFSVTLTITDANTCMNSVTKSISIITGLEDTGVTLNIFPNPVYNQPLIIEENENAGTAVAVSIFNMLGESLYNTAFETSGQKARHEISLTDFPDGIYILRINAGNTLISRKIIKTGN